MKISPNWLKEFVQLEMEPRLLADDLTLAGIAVESVSSGDDAIFEMDITTNRVDAMNHYGIAREISAIYDLDLNPLQAKLPSAKGKANFPIEIQVPQFCSRFTGQVIRNVKIGASGGRVQKRFAELSQKPINNAADATNYVLLEMGKPTHAFDLDKLEGGKLVIRLAKPGEMLKTLDGVERRLHPEDVVVADAKKPVALAGVMGGFDSMITAATKNILIESAWWDPAVVRKTSRRHALHTDASHRFERGADWASCALSCDLVSEIILESGGELDGGIIDVIARPFKREPIQLSLAEVRRILGKEIPATEIEGILRRLGFAVTARHLAAAGRTASTGAVAIVEQPSDYSVEIPTWRLDIEREIDLIEEIARVHGYNKFANTLPSFSGGVIETANAPKQEKVRAIMLALGYNEALSNTFVAKSESQAYSGDTVVEIANPLSEEASAMRASLIPGMLDMLAHNLNRGTQDVRLFEMGQLYSMHGDNTQERLGLCIGATASAIASDIRSTTTADIFRAFKGDIESALLAFEHNSITFHTQTSQEGTDYYRAELDGVAVSFFGPVSPHHQGAQERKLKQEVFVAEIMLDRLFQKPLRTPAYRPLSRYPSVERDFSFLFDDAVNYGRIEESVRTLRLDDLRTVTPVEVFRGGNVPSGKYSMLLRMTFQSNERTLRDDEVALWSGQIVEALKSLGGVQRS
jgi:phenylalanyl-tRNA synthetase beta chain